LIERGLDDPRLITALDDGDECRDAAGQRSQVLGLTRPVDLRANIKSSKFVNADRMKSNRRECHQHLDCSGNINSTR
jgi:hypothetical protein